MCKQPAITVTTARNSGMIGSGWLSGTAFDCPRAVTKTRPKLLWPPLQVLAGPLPTDESLRRE